MIMDSIVAQAKELASISDYATKRDLVDTLRNLATTLEEPGDAVRRLSYAVLPSEYPQFEES